MIPSTLSAGRRPESKGDASSPLAGRATLSANGFRFLVFAIALTGLLITNSALAWGPLGHRIVARLAEAQLAPRARAEVGRLLQEQGARHLSDVAVWADDLRDTDPALFKRTSRQHYVNFHSPDCLYDPPLDCPDGQCVVAAISHYAAILGDRSRPDAERAQALDFVVHFVGDVHQPLHASSGGDFGGNDYQVRWHDRGTNLHRVWDSLMLDDAHLSAAAYTRMLLDEATPVDAGARPRNGPGNPAALHARHTRPRAPSRKPTSSANGRLPNSACGRLAHGWRRCSTASSQGNRRAGVSLAAGALAALTRARHDRPAAGVRHHGRGNHG